jgi:hypothetical protein
MEGRHGTAHKRARQVAMGWDAGSAGDCGLSQLVFLDGIFAVDGISSVVGIFSVNGIFSMLKEVLQGFF